MARRSVRVFAAFLCLLSLFSFSGISARGVDTKEYKQQATFWTMFSGVPILKEFLGYSAGLVCPESDDGYHHASSYEADRENGYYNCICDVCGWPFTAYETDFHQSYDTFVESLENPVVSSSGASLRCYPSSVHNSVVVSSLSEIPQEPYSDAYRQLAFLDRYTLVQSTSTDNYELDRIIFYFQVPVSGYYYLCWPANMYGGIDTWAIYLWGNSNRDNIYSYITYPDNDHSSSVISPEPFYFDSNIIYSFSSFPYPDPVSGNVNTHSATMSLLPDYSQFTGILVDPSDSSSRPTSFTGDYGIIGDNGQITQVDNSSIVNETNNTYTNPCTGTTSTITEWTYDYSDRSYNVTTESGDTVTITYGDENITIQEGDTVYNVYYLVDGDGTPGGDPSESPAPETCQHEYTSITDREATCTFAGQVTYTCSLCGHSYTESIPATGHAWDIKETVQTSYDEEGNLLQQGYTIYKCSVCGEEYKDETGTGPPGSGDGSGSGSGSEGESIWDKLGNFIGTIFGAIIEIISAVIGKILDALIALAEMIGEKLAAVVQLVLSFFDEIPQLFTGFLSFLSAIFPFLPEEVMLLLTFGIAVIVFIGIIKALRR